MRLIFNILIIYLIVALGCMGLVEYYAEDSLKSKGRITSKTQHSFDIIYNSPRSVRLIAYLLWPYYVVCVIYYLVKRIFKE